MAIKQIKIEPDETYVLGVFTKSYAQLNEVDNPKFKPGYEYNYLGNVLNNSGVKTVNELWSKNPYNLDTNLIWYLYKVDATGKKNYLAQGQFVQRNENLSDNVPEAIKSRQQSALSDEHIQTQRTNDIIQERDYLRERVRNLEQLVSQQQQELMQSSNRLMDEAQKRIDAETQLKQAVTEVEYSKAIEIQELKSQIRELQKQHEMEIELKQKAIEETLRDEMGASELAIAKQQQETLMGLLNLGKPALELGLQYGIQWLSGKLNNNNQQQQFTPQQQIAQQGIAPYDPNQEPNMYAPSEVLE